MMGVDKVGPQLLFEMGRLRRKSKWQRRKTRKEVKRHPEAPVSDPETRETSLFKGGEAYSSCTNSCDEALSLCASSLTSCDGKCIDPSLRLLRSPTDEMEVTHRLSCLNFSIDPGDMVRTPQHLQLPSLGFEVVSDVEGCSELASTAQPDLLPTLSDRGEGAEEMVASHYRRARKRSSRRKNNRRSKKFHCISTRDTSFVRAGTNSVSVATPQQPLELGNMARTLSQETLYYGGDSKLDGSRLVRTRSLRRVKRSQQQHQEEDPLLYCLSDTSVVLDLDTPTVAYSGHHQMEGVETTPPALDDSLMSDDTLVMESELSETTSDSGCEGDDEESSVEGPANATPLLPHSPFPQPPPGLALGDSSDCSWWGEQDLEAHTFQQILAGSLPLLTSSGRQKVEKVCNNSSPLTEFKHPGRFGACGRGGTGRKKRCKPSELSCPLTLKDINQKIVAFVRDPSAEAVELKFNFVSRALCKTIAALSECYQLECVIEQKRRLPVASPCLRRTLYTRLATLQEIELILRQHGGREPVGVSPLVSNMQTRGPPRTSNSHTTQSPQSVTVSQYQLAMPPHLVVAPRCQVATPPPVVVGTVYRPLDETNVGNRMLQSMGWRPGAGLGAESDGIKSPVKAYFRSRRAAGLGFN